MKHRGLFVLTLFLFAVAGIGLAGLFGTDSGEGDRNEQSGGSEAAGEGDGEIVVVDSVRYLILDDRSVHLFTYSAAAAELFADALNRFKAAADPGVNVYCLLAPTSAEFVESRKYREMSDSQKAAFARVDGMLDPGIVRIDAYGALEKHRDDYLYFRTDHHWTALGAYYAYDRFMQAIDDEPVALEEYAAGVIEGFLGSDFKATSSEKLKANPDAISYYAPLREYVYTAYSTKDQPLDRRVVDPKYAGEEAGFYAVFLGGDFPWGKIETGNRNGKRIVVVKDSYANAFIPFLLPHFETVYYIDPRTFKGNLNDFAKEREITDVLFLYSSTAARTTSVGSFLNAIQEH